MSARLLSLGLGLALATTARAEISAGGIGHWQFHDPSRPVKAVLIGGSISAYPKGNYGDYLQLVCAKLEVENLALAKLGAHHLYVRFQNQVIKNTSLAKAWPENFWLIYLGGLNSVQMPQDTNRAIRDTFVAAHGKGLKVIGLSLLPWGSEKDSRWRGANGLEIRASTRLVVDFVMGRLTPAQALGELNGNANSSFSPDELADIKVDLYSEGLRASDAQPRNSPNLAREVEHHRWVRHELATLQPDERQTKLAALVEEAQLIPQWFMKKSYQAFDHFHPNEDGHRLIATKVCPNLPAEFQCQCERLPQIAWNNGMLRDSTIPH